MLCVWFATRGYSRPLVLSYFEVCVRIENNNNNNGELYRKMRQVLLLYYSRDLPATTNMP